MSELDTKYVDEALNYKKKAKKPGWVKWGAMAACFAVIAVLGVGVFQSGLFGNKTVNALKRVSVFSNPASSLVKLQLKENEMLVSAQDIDFSTSAEEKIVCSFDGTELSIGFKATYLIEILSNINSEEVILELADPSRAGLIVPSENEENEDLLMLLMPMMLND